MNLNISLFPTLATGRLLLRQLSEQDVHEIFVLRSDPAVNMFIERPKPTHIDEAMEFIRKVNRDVNEKRSLYWAISTGKDPKLIGTICLWNFSDQDTIAELGYELLPAFQGKGFMLEAIARVLYFGFKEIHLKRIEAFTNKENLRSLNLLRKTGFSLEPERTDEDNRSNLIFSISVLEFRKSLKG